ncbi:hypothetical protein [Streptomyces sp. NPDC005281]|uniref:hypothetical protein n=1 Tax=Streptomyces sp. NPDC005281 TaxID=3155712 RepID=UPI0033B37F27
MGGSAKPRRRRAAGAAPGRERQRQRQRQRQRPNARDEKRASRGESVVGCLALITATAAVAGFALTVMTWGSELWGRAAPASPGGGYGFAALAGALLPVGLTVVIVTLTRMKWKPSPLRSIGWVLASLPGVAAVLMWAVVVFAGFRPRHRRDWHGGCYSRGGPCWVHAEYPWVWAVGLLSTVLVAAALITAAVRITKAREASADGPDTAVGPDTPAGTDTAAGPDKANRSAATDGNAAAS